MKLFFLIVSALSGGFSSLASMEREDVMGVTNPLIAAPATIQTTPPSCGQMIRRHVEEKTDVGHLSNNQLRWAENLSRSYKNLSYVSVLFSSVPLWAVFCSCWPLSLQAACGVCCCMYCCGIANGCVCDHCQDKLVDEKLRRAFSRQP